MSKLHKALWMGLALSALLFSGCAGENAGTTPEIETDPAAEPSAPQVTFEGIDMEGNAVDSDIFSQSKLTMVNVWATYCNPCLSEMPGLGELAAEYEPEEFQIIGIVSDVLAGDDEGLALAGGLVQLTGADYPHLLVNESVYYALLTEVTAVPTTYFLDGDGVILDTVIGAMEKSSWEDKINGLLEQQ